MSFDKVVQKPFHLFFWVLFWGLLCIPRPALAQPEVKVSVDREPLYVGEAFALQIEAVGGEASTPDLPEHEAISIDTSNIVRNERMLSSSIDFRGGISVTHRMRWEYKAVAMEAGTHTLPPIRVEIDGEVHESEPLEITVLEEEEGDSSRRSSTPGVDDAIIIETEVDKERVYQGEQVNLTLRLLQISRRGIIVVPARRGTLPLPATDGFYTGPIRDARIRDRRRGFDYVGRAFMQTLYPTRPGELEIGPWQWQGHVEGRTPVGYQRVFREYETDPIPIEVLPLPERPDDFSGAVGRFQLDLAMDSEMQQGIPEKLRVRIIGQGNPDSVGNLHFPTLSWAHVSSPTTTLRELDPDPNSWRQFEKDFMFDVTALEAGQFEIPAIAFTYFSPEEEAYITEATEEVTVEVRPSAESTALVTAGGEPNAGQVEILSDDVFSIITTAQAMTPQGGRTLGFALLFFLPPLVYVGAFVLARHQRHLLENPAYARSRKAHAHYLKQLEGLDAASDPTLHIHQALVGYIEDKFNVQNKGFTSHDVAALMQEHEAPRELAEQVEHILRTCERKRYAGVAINAAEIAALKSAATGVVDDLEAFLRQGR